MIADRLAKDAICPLLSSPGITSNPSGVGYQLKLLRQPCILEACPCSYHELHPNNGVHRKIYFCSFLNVQIGEADPND